MSTFHPAIPALLAQAQVDPADVMKALKGLRAQARAGSAPVEPASDAELTGTGA